MDQHSPVKPYDLINNTYRNGPGVISVLKPGILRQRYTTDVIR